MTPLWYRMSHDERRRHVEDGVAQGQSAREIGEAAGVSRNVIIGWSRRNAVKLRPPTTEQANAAWRRRGLPQTAPRRPAKVATLITSLREIAAKVKAARPAPKPTPPPARVIPVPIQPPGRVTTLSRREEQCAYPVEGRGVGMLMCGAPAAGGSWCAVHRLLVYERRPSRDRQRLVAAE